MSGMSESARRIAEKHGLVPEGSLHRSGVLTRSLAEGLARNPEDYTKDIAAARSLNLPVDAVEGQRESLDFDLRMKEIGPETLVDSAPATARALSDPKIASIAHDDAENLWLYERAWGELSQRKKRGDDTIELGNLGRKVISGQSTSDDELLIRILQSREMKDYGVPDAGVLGWVAGVPGATAEILPMAVDSIKHRAVGGALGFGAGLITGPGAIFSAAGGQAIGGFISAADTEAGNAFLEFREIEGADEDLARALALGVGAFNGLLEGAGMGFVLKKMPILGPIIQSGTRAGVRKVIANPVMRNIFLQAGTVIASGAASEFMTEFAQELTVIAGDLTLMSDAGKGLDDFVVSHQAEDGTIIELRGVAAVWKRAIDAGIQGSQGGAGVSALSQASGALSSGVTASGNDVISKVSGLVKTSKLRERDPRAYQDFVKSAMAENPDVPRNVTIRAEGIRRFFQQEGDSEGDAEVDQAARREAIEEALSEHPDLAAQVDQSLLTGADVTIPYDVYEAYLAGREFAEQALPDTTFFDDLPTPSELESEGLAQAELSLPDLSERVQGERGDDQVERVVREELTAQFSKQLAPGITEPVVELFVSQMRTAARRRGMSLKDWVTQEGLLRVETTDQDAGAAALPNLNDRLSEAGTRRVVEDIRAGRTPNVPRGTPVLQMMLDMGGVDPDSVLGQEVSNLIPASGEGSRPSLLSRRGRKIPGSDERVGPLRDVDNLVADEFPELAGFIDVDESSGFFDRQGLLDELDRESRGLGRIVDPEQERVLNDALEERQSIEQAIEDADIAFDELTDDEVVEALLEQGQPSDSANASQANDGRRRLDSEGRGEISVDEDTRDVVIRFTESADLSTLLHEGWHLFMLQLERDVTRGDLPAPMVEDWNLLREFVGVAEGEALTSAHHEALARAGELYLREGNAPSIRLQAAFERFMTWLIDTYRRLRFSGYFEGIQLTDDVRQALDRIVATDQEIDEQRSARGLGTFPDVLGEIMTPEELQAHETNLDNARAAEKQSMRRRMLAEQNRKQGKDWKSKKKVVREEATAAIDSEPVYQARHWLAHGTFREGHEVEAVSSLPHQKLSKDALVRMKGQDILKVFPREGVRLIWQKRGGHHPDTLAELFAFESAEVMLNELAAMPSRKEAIEQRTEAEMEKRFGKFADQAALSDAVTASILNQKELEVLAAEERAYARRTGNEPTPMVLIRRIAAANVGRMQVFDARPDVFRRSAMKSARDKVLLADAGDIDGAQRALRQQMFSLAMEAELRQRKDLADKGFRYFRKVQSKIRKSKIIKAGAKYWEQIDGMLSRYELRNISKVRSAKRKGLAEFIAEIERDDDATVVITEKMRNEADAHNWKTLTFNELEGMVASIKNIEHLALRKLQLMVGSEHRSFEAIVTELQSEMESNLGLGAARELRNKGFFGEGEVLRRSLVSYLDKMEFVIERLDGRKPDGPWRRNVWRPLRDAASKRNEMNEKYTVAFARMVDGLTKGKLDEYLAVKHHPELASKNREGDFTRVQLIAILLNMGNEGNKGRLLRGERWSEAGILAVMERELSPEDLAFVQGTWDLIDQLWPEIVEQEKRLSGVIPKKVERSNVEIGGIVLEGGYYPIAYDRDRSRLAKIISEKGNVFDQTESQFARPMTGHSHVNERGHGLDSPLILDLGLVVSHLDRVILDLTHRETLLRVDRMTQEKGLQESLGRTVGIDRADLFRPWLQHIARSAVFDHRNLSKFEKVARHLRISQTTYILGFRATTLAMQFGGHSNSIELIRRRFKNDGDWKPYYVDALRTTMGGGRPQNMAEVYNSIAEMSPFMRDRPGFIDREFRDAIQSASGTVLTADGFGGEVAAKAVRGMREATRSSMQAIALVQLYGVDIPTWLTAFHAGQDLKGLSEEAAADFADQMVSMTQGSAGPMDQNAVQRAHEGVKMFTLYSSYQMTVFAQLQSTIQDFKQGDASMTDVISSGMFFIMIPAIYAAFVRTALTGRNQIPDEEDESLMGWLVGIGLAELAGTVPFLRSLGSIGKSLFETTGRYYPDQVPVQRLTTKVNDLVHPKSSTEFLFDSLNLFGMLTGLPISDIASRTEKFLEE